MYFFVDEVFWLCLGHRVFLPSLAKEELLPSLCVQELWGDVATGPSFQTQLPARHSRDIPISSPPRSPCHTPRASHHIHFLGCISHTRGTGDGLRSPVLPLSLPPQEITVCNLMPALQERRESLSQSARLLLLYLFCAGLAYTGSLKQSQLSRPSWPEEPYPKQTQVIL